MKVVLSGSRIEKIVDIYLNDSLGEYIETKEHSPWDGIFVKDDEVVATTSSRDIYVPKELYLKVVGVFGLERTQFTSIIKRVVNKKTGIRVYDVFTPDYPFRTILW
jgi:hypothetical protein